MSWNSSKSPFKYQLSPHEEAASLSVCVAPLSASAKQASSIISKKEEEGPKEGREQDRGGCLAQMTSSAKMMNGRCCLGAGLDLWHGRR